MHCSLVELCLIGGSICGVFVALPIAGSLSSFPPTCVDEATRPQSNAAKFIFIALEACGLVVGALVGCALSRLIIWQRRSTASAAAAPS